VGEEESGRLLEETFTPGGKKGAKGRLITNEVKPLSNTRENTIKPFGFLFP
jgi:hypothetical protein